MIALQKAIKAKVSTLDYPVLDRFPHKQDKQRAYKMPYIVIGDDVLTPFDADGQTGFSIVLNLHIWSDFLGREECKRIQQDVYDLLHRQRLNVEGYFSVSVDFQFSDTTLENDGVLTHGVSQFRFIGVKNG
jgi:hypothetical protein